MLTGLTVAALAFVGLPSLAASADADTGITIVASGGMNLPSCTYSADTAVSINASSVTSCLDPSQSSNSPTPGSASLESVSGGIHVDAPVGDGDGDLNSLTLHADDGDVDESAEGGISVGVLTATAPQGSVALNYGQNALSILNATAGMGSASIETTRALTVGDVTAPTGGVSLTTQNALTLTGNITAGDGGLILGAGGSIAQTGGSITTDAPVTVQATPKGDGDVILTSSSNDFDTFTASSVGATLAVASSTWLTVANVSATGAATVDAPAVAFVGTNTFDGNLTIGTNGAVSETGSLSVAAPGILTLGDSTHTPSSATLTDADLYQVAGQVSGAVVLDGASGFGSLTAGSISDTTTATPITLSGSLTATAGSIVLDASSGSTPQPIVGFSGPSLTASGTVRLYSSSRDSSAGNLDGTEIQSTTYTGTSPEFGNTLTEHWHETSADTDVPTDVPADGSYRVYYADQGSDTVTVGVAPASPGTYPTAETITATVTASGGQQGASLATPTGTVSFSDGGTTLNCNGSGSNAVPVSQLKAGVATAECALPTTGLPVQSSDYTISAAYASDDATAYPNTSATTSYHKGAASPTLSLTNTPSGGSVTGATNGYPNFSIGAMVTGPTGGSTPTGTVDFSTTVGSQETTLCSDVTITSSGTASCAATLPLGVDSISASYTSTDADYTSTSTTEPSTVEVDAAPTVSSTAGSPEVGQPYSQTVTTTPGYPTDVEVSDGGTLPAGLTLSPDGTTISGTPTAAGSYRVTLTASNSKNLSAVTTFALQVAQAATITSLTVPAAGTVVAGDGSAVTATVSPVPDGGHVHFTVDGTSYSGDDDVDTATGTATYTLPAALAGGEYTVDASYVGDTDYAASDAQQKPLEVDQAPQVVADQTLATGQVGQPYSQSIQVTAGYPTTTTVSATGLPAGLAMNESDTAVVGTPTGSGTFTATFTPQTTTGAGTPLAGKPVQLRLTVYPADSAPYIATTSLPNGTVGAAYDAPITVDDGYPSGETVSVSGLPIGLSYDPNQQAIVGTPAHASTSTVVVTADNGLSSQRTLDLDVDPAATITTLTLTPASVTRGTAVTASATVDPDSTGGTVQFSVDGTDVGSPVAIDPSGTASLAVDTANLSPGQHVVRAAFVGTADYLVSNDQHTLAVTPVVDPAITAKLSGPAAKSSYGWWSRQVTVTFACTAGSAPVTCPAPFTVRHNGRHVVSRTITAADGGTARIRVRVDLDDVPPQVSVAGARDGATYRSVRQLTCHATDSLSGIASCRLSTSRHGRVVSWTAVATDRAGNTATTTGSYRLVR